LTTPPVPYQASSSPPTIGIFWFGNPSCHRTISARPPPTNSHRSVVMRNCRPICLWSVEKMYFPKKPGSWCAWPLS
jgi:hypothetical protein